MAGEVQSGSPALPAAAATCCWYCRNAGVLYWSRPPASEPKEPRSKESGVDSRDRGLRSRAAPLLPEPVAEGAEEEVPATAPRSGLILSCEYWRFMRASLRLGVEGTESFISWAIAASVSSSKLWFCSCCLLEALVSTVWRMCCFRRFLWCCCAACCSSSCCCGVRFELPPPPIWPQGGLDSMGCPRGSGALCVLSSGLGMVLPPPLEDGL